MTIDAAIARWCARPIDTGHPGLTLTPLVLGPEGVPVVTDAEQAKAAPEAAVLEARGLEVPTEVRERVLASTELAELDRWLRRAAVVSDTRELLATTGS
ncbi:hypothetical protein [Sorangium cellulosum]|uniref:Uncharacterized protein n=1 Tax=Sorangium cellulosum TaxID=56 RepID=A0A150R0P2_SORCE|nr:hypothetical protein [Sorangium cellulosum]KYF73763.1 hypothetical protein BE15_47575 [Sorangium cellulosum]